MNEFEFSIADFILAIKRRILLVLIITIITTLFSGIYTVFFIEDKYQSSATLFPQLVFSGELIDYEQLNANNALLNTYVELLKSSEVISSVSDKLNVNYGTVQAGLSVWKHSSTQLITVQASTNNPHLSKSIVDATLEVFYEKIASKIEISNLITLTEAQLSTSPISANLTKNLLTGGIIGMAISLCIIFLQFIFANRIHNKQEAETYFNLPVLGIIPDMENMNELY